MTAPSVTAIDSAVAALAKRMEITTVHGVLLNLSERIAELVEQRGRIIEQDRGDKGTTR